MGADDDPYDYSDDDSEFKALYAEYLARQPKQDDSAISGGFHRIVGRAGRQAERLKSPYIGAEHILLAIAADRRGRAARVLRSMGVDLRAIRAAVLARLDPDDQLDDYSEMIVSPSARMVIRRSSQEARSLGHRCLGPEHLLLSLLDGDWGIASEVLQENGASLADARRAVERVLRQPLRLPLPGWLPGPKWLFLASWLPLRKRQPEPQ
jgi:hypothetical protein